MNVGVEKKDIRDNYETKNGGGPKVVEHQAVVKTHLGQWKRPEINLAGELEKSGSPSFFGLKDEKKAANGGLISGCSNTLTVGAANLRSFELHVFR